MEPRIAAVVFASLFAVGSAWAAGGSQHEKMDFTNLDADGNGVISKQEAQAQEKLSQNWDEADKNSDGQVDRSEFSAFEQSIESVPGSEE